MVPLTEKKSLILIKSISSHFYLIAYIFEILLK